VRKPLDTDWTDHKIATLTTKWGEGKPTLLIAREMGLTKNSIVGKAHRLDLPARPTPIRPPRDPSLPPYKHPPRRKALTLAALLEERAVKPPEAPKPPTRPFEGARALEIARERAIEAARVSIPKEVKPPPAPAPAARVGSATCQFPLWGPGRVPKPPRFCDAAIPLGQSWCAEHRAVVFTRVSGWGQKAPVETDTQPRPGAASDALLDPA
jgi:GcrA cell cycle regulator